MVTAATGALYAVWRIAVMPVLRAAARRVLHNELDALERNNTAIGRMWAEQFEQRDLLQRIEEGQRELRDMVMEIRGREGGRRAGDR